MRGFGLLVLVACGDGALEEWSGPFAVDAYLEGEGACDGVEAPGPDFVTIGFATDDVDDRAMVFACSRRDVCEGTPRWMASLDVLSDTKVRASTIDAQAVLLVEGVECTVSRNTLTLDLTARGELSMEVLAWHAPAVVVSDEDGCVAEAEALDQQEEDCAGYWRLEAHRVD